MERSVFHVERDHTDTLAVLHEQIERKVFDEKVGVVSEGLSVQSVQDGVTCSISGGGTSVGLSTLAVLEGLTTERSLVDLSFLGSGEGNTVVLELTSYQGDQQSTCTLLPRLYSPR
jgi:ribosomal protein S6E (S10)